MGSDSSFQQTSPPLLLLPHLPSTSSGTPSLVRPDPPAWSGTEDRRRYIHMCTCMQVRGLAVTFFSSSPVPYLSTVFFSPLFLPISSSPLLPYPTHFCNRPLLPILSSLPFPPPLSPLLPALSSPLSPLPPSSLPSRRFPSQDSPTPNVMFAQKLEVEGRKGKLNERGGKAMQEGGLERNERGY